MTANINQHKRPLHVLILTYIYTDYDPRYGGEGRVVWETTHALARAGVKVFVVTSMQKLGITPHPNIQVYKIPLAKKDFLNFNPGELLKIFLFSIPLIFIHRIDVIHHLPTNGPDPFARFKFGRVFAESADPGWEYENPAFGKELQLDNAQKGQAAGFVKVPWYAINFWPRAALRFFTLIGVNEKFPKGTDIFFCRARSVHKDIKAARPESELIYVPNGVDTREFSPSTTPLFARTQKGLRFLHVGSVSRRKGVYYLVEAFISTLPTHPENELFIVGRGHPDFVKELQEKSVQYPQIRFYDNISNEDLSKVYASVDVFCLVPLSGSTPTVLAEAMASGLPIIATTGSGSGEVVAEYDAGFLVAPGNSSELAKAMVQTMDNKSELQKKAANSLLASKFFSWDYIASELIQGYKKILGIRKKNKMYSSILF